MMRLILRAIVVVVMWAAFAFVVLMPEPSRYRSADSSIFADKSSIGGANE